MLNIFQEKCSTTLKPFVFVIAAWNIQTCHNFVTNCAEINRQRDGFTRFLLCCILKERKKKDSTIKFMEKIRRIYAWYPSDVT